MKNIKNSQYNTRWITNGVINAKISQDTDIPLGWYLGRVNVHTEQSKKILSQKCKNNNPEKRKKTILEKYGSFKTENREKAINDFWEVERKRKKTLAFEYKSLFYKRKHILEEQNGKCLHCTLSEWLGSPLKFELDHVDGNKKNNLRSNLRLLCPNCHSYTDTWRKKK